MTLSVRTFDQPGDQASWDQFVQSATRPHVLQTWAWGELKARFGWRVRRLAVGSSGAQVLFRPLPARLGSIAYVPRGPVGDLDDQTALHGLLDAVRTIARRHRAICLKIEPYLEDGPEQAKRLRASGFQRSPQEVQPRSTILVDLEAEPDELLARMKQKTRYNVRLAGRRGVTVRPGDDRDLPAFYRLMEVTAERDGFGIHSQAYYEATYELFALSGQGRLLLAEYEGRLLGGVIVLAFGPTAIYVAGASSDEERQRMPTYLLQWEAMLWARERGCRLYDLWGVPDEDQETLEAEFTQRRDGLWGVYRFKRGFGGRLVRTVGAWDLVYAPLRYRLYAMAVGWRDRGQGG